MNAPLLQEMYTPQDLLEFGEPGFELLDGRIVEKGMGAKSSLVNSALAGLLGPFVRAHRLGFPFEAEAGYEVFPNRPRVRKPDYSVVLKGRLPGGEAPDGWIKIAPDFAAEVASHNDKADEIMSKAVEWLAVGVRLLWVLFPVSRTVIVMRPDGSAAWFGPGGMLSGEDILPGFTCAVDELFADLTPQA